MAYAAQKSQFAKSAKKSASVSFASSPAGRHRRLALNCFALARKARAAGNRKHYSALVALGKRALALSNREIGLWKLGRALTRRSFATQRFMLRQTRLRGR